mgnify:CR=1 FL=1
MPVDRPALPDDLLVALTRLDGADAVALLLDDLLTPAEVRSVGERWQIVKRLAAGDSQRKVRDALNVSITTVSRGANQARYGAGGFNLAFDALVSAGYPDPRRSSGPQEPASPTTHAATTEERT